MSQQVEKPGAPTMPSKAVMAQTKRNPKKAKTMDEQCRKRVRLQKGIWLRCQLRDHGDDNHFFDSPIRLRRVVA
jgi:hypothetical protein